MRARNPLSRVSFKRTLGDMAEEDFAPRTAIVTGSDSGIGRATAVALAEAGLDIGITWHSDEDGAEETARLVRDAGRRAVVGFRGVLAQKQDNPTLKTADQPAYY